MQSAGSADHSRTTTWWTFLLLVATAAFLVAATTCVSSGLARGEGTTSRAHYEVDVGWNGILFTSSYSYPYYYSGGAFQVSATWTELDDVEYNWAVYHSANFCLSMVIIGWVAACGFAGALGLRLYGKCCCNWLRRTVPGFACFYVIFFAIALILFHVYGAKFADAIHDKSEMIETTESGFNVGLVVDINGSNFGRVTDMTTAWWPTWGIILCYLAEVFWVAIAVLAQKLPVDNEHEKQAVAMSTYKEPPRDETQ